MHTITVQDETPAVQITGLSFSYKQTRQAPPVLQIPNWQVRRGERVFLLGASGSGKSTLLNLLTGILKPNAGQIQVLGRPLNQLSARQRDKFRARHIGFVMQQFNLVPYLSVLDNIVLAQHFANCTGAQTRERIETLLTQMHISVDLLQRPAQQLSVGQQQRVAIARALINQPELLIVDEPTSALDADAAEVFMEHLLRLCTQLQSTLIFVSHDRGYAHFFDRTQDLTELNQAGDTRHAD